MHLPLKPFIQRQIASSWPCYDTRRCNTYFLSYCLSFSSFFLFLLICFSWFTQTVYVNHAQPLFNHSDYIITKHQISYGDNYTPNKYKRCSARPTVSAADDCKKLYIAVSSCIFLNMYQDNKSKLDNYQSYFNYTEMLNKVIRYLVCVRRPILS